MIHTIQVVFPIDATDVQFITRKIGQDYTKVNDYYHPQFTSVNFSIYRAFVDWHLSMHIDVIKLLGKADITEGDYLTFESKIKFILFNLFGHTQYYRRHSLKRIDYRHDVVIRNKKHREILLHIYKKLRQSYRFQKRYLGKLDWQGKFINYETTVYHSSNSIRAIVYDKEAERLAKNECIEPHEKNILRFEVAVGNKHILYKNDANKCKQTRKNQIKYYFKDDVMREYFQKYLKPIYQAGDYYSYKKLKDIIEQSNYRPAMKEKLKQFILSVANGDLDTPLRKGMHRATYNDRLKKLADLNVNPLTIPKHFGKGCNFIQNPLTPLFK